MCYKKLYKWMKSKIKIMEPCDISMIKLSTAAFTLMVAKLWAPLLSLDWYWYLVIALVAAIKPTYKIFK
jgi:hypothetical protein